MVNQGEGEGLMTILEECPICYREQFGGQIQAKTEGYGGNNGGYCLFSKIKEGLEFVSNPIILLLVAGAGFEPTTFGL